MWYSDMKKYTKFLKFVALVQNGWRFIMFLNTAYYTSKVCVIITESLIYKKLLK